MLIEFRVKNYRSIKDEQVLSLVAAKEKTHSETHLMETGIKSIPALVRSAVLYGPNAGGKTNLVNALASVRDVVANSVTAMQLGQKFNLQPFRLDTKTAEEPSEFELTFVEDGVRYQYGFILSPERVNEEWLLVYKTSKPQQWFTRRFNPDTRQDEYEFGSFLTGLTGQRKLWQESTRPNALFLSTAVHLNSEQLRPIFNWIVNKLVIFPASFIINPSFSVDMLQSNEGKKAIEKFLVSAGISIAGINLISRKGWAQTVLFNHLTGETNAPQREEKDILSPQFLHETEHGSAIFEFQEESLGTQRLFALAGPILDILKLGRILIVDELDSSMHSLLVRHLVNVFHNPLLNLKGAQLIFTTHDTSLLSQEVFRRDQIWFVEKNRHQATTFCPLTEFSPRKNEALERGYLSGRYGAVPFFRNLN